ncbi:MAG: class I SAM-dependent methyltransferase [bacterium]
MAQYLDYAEYYDLDHNTQVDVEFYLDYARQCGSPILELACGTGRLTIPLAEAGHEIYGVDFSENMLALCRGKIEGNNLVERIHLFCDNMTRFDLPRKDFTLVFIPVRSFMHLFTQSDQLACLRRAFEHLRPGGLFIVDVYAPAFSVLAQEPDGSFRKRGAFELPNGHSVIRKDRFVKNDPVKQIQHVEIRFEETDGTGALVRERIVPMDTRYTFRYELQLLLERVGFELVDVFGDYDKSTYDGSGEIIMVARRPL